MHDNFLAGKYFVVYYFPLRLEPLKFLSGLWSLSDCLRWTPEQSTEIYIFDREDMSHVTTIKTDAMFVFHFANGCQESDGNIYVEYVDYRSWDEISPFLTQYP